MLNTANWPTHSSSANTISTFRFGVANSVQAAIDLPESLTWLWRGYDPAKTSEDFVIDPAEKDKPYYRVSINNRDSW